MARRIGAPPPVAAILRRPAERLLSELRALCGDSSDVGAVHDARVAARRLVAAGDLWAPRVRGWSLLRREVLRVVKRLGRVRNLDVTLRLLSRDSVGMPTPRRAFARWARRQRRKERSRLSRWLTEHRVSRLQGEIRGFVDAADRRSSAPPGPRQLRPYLERISRRPVGHSMRRDVRQLRYAHETLWWAFPPAAHGRLGGALHDVQDVAGAWQDLCVMKKLAAKAERKGRLDVPLEGFMKDVARRARTLYDRFARSLKAFVRGRDRLTEDGC